MSKANSLRSIVNKYKSIVWYPSSALDFSFVNLLAYDLPKHLIDSQDTPDCIVMTDLNGDNLKYLEKMAIGEKFKDFKNIEIKSVTSLPKINIRYEPKYFDLFYDEKYYGKSVSINLIVNGQSNIKEITLIYVCVENIVFATDYLIKNNIYIKYIINHNWGMGSSFDNMLPFIYLLMKSKYYISSYDYDNYGCITDYENLVDLLNLDVRNLKEPIFEKIHKFNNKILIYDIYLYIIK